MLALFAFAVPAQAACPSGAAALSADVDAVLDAYAALDMDQFPARFAVLEADLACLAEVPSPAIAARLHLAYALEAWLDKRSADAYSALRGALAADPGLEIGPQIAPPGSSLGVLVATARAAAPPASAVPSTQQLAIDGVSGQQWIPAERSTLVQYQDPTAGLRTWYLTGGPLPADLRAALAGGVPPAGPRLRPSRALLIGGVGVGVAAGASLALAAGARSSFYATPQDEAHAGEAQAFYARNRILGYTGYGLAAASGGLIVVALVQGEW